MRIAVAKAGMVSAAVLLAPGCSGPDPQAARSEEPVRRSSFRALVARHHLSTCPDGASRRETAFQLGRLEELKQLAARKQAGHQIWLGENDWNGIARYSDRPPCAAGEAAYVGGLTGFSASLDRLAQAIAGYRP